jgi:diguanylate cyclase (GGDEF)-like protein
MFNTITGIDILNVEEKGAIFFVEDDRLQLVSHVGFSDIFLDLHKNIKVGDCLCGLAAEKGEVIISTNCRKDSRHTIACSRSENHGHFIIPLNARGQVVGVLCLYTHPDIDIDESKLKLLESIGNQVGVAIDNARLHEETRKYSLHDPLTGLANRRMMYIVFERIINRAKRFDEPFSIIMLDIDYFKKYNDQFGHTEGDRLLKKLAKIILKEVRQIDLAVRYGGEEFLILLPETDLIKACDIAERMRKAVERQTKITISLGVSSHKKSMKTKEVFISKADKALYMAKKNGRNRVEKSN